MSMERQCYWRCDDPSQNIKEAGLFFTIYYLFRIFKELNPRLFKKQYNGRPRIYTPDIMLPFVCWGHMNDIISCRNLEKWWSRNDDTCNIFLNCKKPGKSSINEFLNDFSELIDLFDIFIVEFGLKTGLMNGDIQYEDGTFLKGYCNEFKKLYKNQLYFLKDFITEHSSNQTEDGSWFKMKKYFENEEYVDEVEPIIKKLKKEVHSNGIYLLKKSLNGSDALREVLMRIEHMEENINGNNPISIIDPDARNMKDKDGIWGFNYNYQLAVDGKFGLITAHYITQSSNDRKEALRMVGILNEILGTDEYVLCVDNGYWHIESLHKMHTLPTEIVIPDTTSASKTKAELRKEYNPSYYRYKSDEELEKEKFKPYNFFYDEENDVYIGPYGCILTRNENTRAREGVKYRVYSTKECKSCPYNQVCTTKSKNKKEISVRDDGVLDNIKSVYRSPWGQEIYKGRAPNAEGAFAALQESRNFRGIKTRGVKRVNDELTLTAITHNVKKIDEHMNVNVLKTILNEIKKAKKACGRVDMGIFDNWKDKFTFNEDVIVDLKI